MRLGSEKLKGGTIRVYVGAVSSTCVEFGSDSPISCELHSIIKGYEVEDGTVDTEAFDLVDDLPKCVSFDACSISRSLYTYPSTIMFIFRLYDACFFYGWLGA
jgi:hypothetical protein